MLSLFPRDVFDEILDLIGSVSEGFPTYSCLLIRIRLVVFVCFGILVVLLDTLEILVIRRFCRVLISGYVVSLMG